LNRQFAQLEEKVAGLQYHPSARFVAPAAVEPQYSGTIGILSAGTADLSVAEEAATAEPPAPSAAALGCGRCWYPPLAE